MGSVEKRGKNKFRLSIVTGYNERGNPVRIRKTITAKNKTEARKILSQLESDYLTDQLIETTDMRLTDFYPLWLEKHAQEAYSPGTRGDYINIINKRILPKYGHIKLKDFKTIHIVDFVDDLKKPGRRLNDEEGYLSASTIRNCYKAFNSLLKHAHKWGLIKANPAEGVALPSAKQKHDVDYSSEIIWKMIERISHEDIEKQLIFWTAFITGCRQGELAAIEDRHVVLKDGKYAIYIEQSLTEEKGKGLVLKSIKNNVAGYVAIPEPLADMLNKQILKKRRDKLLLQNQWAYPGKVFIFSNEVGKPYRPDSISQWWIRFRKRNDLGNVRFHDLRHLSVTYLIHKGLPIKTISDRARHTNIGTTMNLYGHNIVEIDQVAADHFGEFFTTKEVK
ncbi:site-specific integrase [Halalkalibacillus sediminis]|uniref:Site-specific integrase n=1 Tax=Halalkalibacillus sediminis TaxID=2018042 RepID=A0A2I0QY10_9BACI|nr:site-specific integrase [Halalkalibacillus sediminis]PKR79217.1 site-specific integrase [Halalkalibacillus sediminis]